MGEYVKTRLVNRTGLELLQYTELNCQAQLKTGAIRNNDSMKVSTEIKPAPVYGRIYRLADEEYRAELVIYYKDLKENRIIYVRQSVDGKLFKDSIPRRVKDKTKKLIGNETGRRLELREKVDRPLLGLTGIFTSLDGYDLRTVSKIRRYIYNVRDENTQYMIIVKDTGPTATSQEWRGEDLFVNWTHDISFFERPGESELIIDKRRFTWSFGMFAPKIKSVISLKRHLY